MLRPSLDIGAMEQDKPEKQEDVAKIQGEISLLNDQFNNLSIGRRVALNDYLDLKGNIRVFCRICPLQGEIHRHESPIVTSDSSKVILKTAKSKSKQYCFDKVFHRSSTQEEVFTEVEPVIKSAVEGYNICIFAYGQTGTGKTYTMEGKPEDPGIVPRVIKALFEQASESNFMLEFTFSMLEIYLGSIRDLLAPPCRKLMVQKLPKSLLIKSNSAGGVEIDNLVSVKVRDIEQVKRLYTFGSRLRSQAPTMSNSTSSRSHCLVRISISSSKDIGRRIGTNKIWMVDLGGSERLLKTQSSGRRLEEGKAINLSLSALGDVISALHGKKTHVPYRNSKLTQVLRDCLGADSKTLMLLHISPKEADICETVCSLGFATRVKSIHLGSEESAVSKNKKELAMSGLLWKINEIEDERHEVKQKIEGLLHKQLQLFGSKGPNEGKLESSHEDADQKQPNKVDKLHKSKCSTRDLNLPRFMRPTVCSQRKAGNRHMSATNSKKPQIHRQRHRPVSVYADSIHGSECSISAISNVNLKDTADNETECSIDTSEYEVKEIILLEPEKFDVNEVEFDQASKLHMKKNIANQIQSDMKEQNNSQTVPAEVTSLSSNNTSSPSIIKDACKGFSKVMDINSENSVECTVYDGDAGKSKTSILLLRSKKSLMFKDIEEIDNAPSVVGDTAIVHISNWHQKEKHERGTKEMLRKSVQMLWYCTLLALRIQDAGFDNDFYQGLLQ